MEEKQYQIPGTLLQEVVNYLQARPFIEVAGVLSKLITVINSQNKAALAPVEAPKSAEGN